uniref:Uncharacterized protein n=1 Tax=Chenopodium quinoa TaxID=63459 RepID=A0A803LRV9_CHEQI
MFSRGSTSGGVPSGGGGFGRGFAPLSGNGCTTCGKAGHMAEQCWTVVGYPTWHAKHQQKPVSAFQKGKGKISPGNNKWGNRNKGNKVAANIEALLKMLPKQSFGDNDEETEHSYAGMVSCHFAESIENEWIIDSGASDHMTGYLNTMHDVVRRKNSPQINLPTGQTANITHFGNVNLGNNLSLKNVLMRSGLYYLENKPIETVIGQLKAQISGEEESEGKCAMNVSTYRSVPTVVTNVPKLSSRTLWHHRLGHAPIQRIEKIHGLKGVKEGQGEVCLTCPLEKLTKLPYAKSESRAKEPFDLVHIDTWGPHRVCTKGKYKYFMTIVDDHTRVIWVNLMVQKSDAFKVLEKFAKMVGTQYGRKIKILRSDNAPEFEDQKCKPFNPSISHDKLDARGIPCIFMGYPSNQKGYKLISLINSQAFVSMDVNFYENIFPYHIFHTASAERERNQNNEQNQSWIDDDDDKAQSDSESEEVYEEETETNNSAREESNSEEMRISSRQTKAPVWHKDYKVGATTLSYANAIRKFADTPASENYFWSSMEMICEEERYLNSQFKMKDMGELKYFLGIEADRSDAGIFLSQRKYVMDILQEYNMKGCKPLRLPMDVHHKLTHNTGTPLTQPEKYQRLIRKLIYLTITRPDIAFTVHTLSQFMHSPTYVHYQAAIRVLRYFSGSRSQGILLAADSAVELKAYCDSDWASCPITRKSTSSFCILLGDSPISWKAKKQQVVARSTAEAEYRSMALTICEVMWLKQLLKDLGLKSLKNTPLFCDNQAALALAENPVQHERTKHVEIDCHFIREKVIEGTVIPTYVKSSEQLTDLFTKVVSTEQYNQLLGRG